MNCQRFSLRASVRYRFSCWHYTRLVLGIGRPKQHNTWVKHSARLYSRTSRRKCNFKPCDAISALVVDCPWHRQTGRSRDWWGAENAFASVLIVGELDKITHINICDGIFPWQNVNIVVLRRTWRTGAHHPRLRHLSFEREMEEKAIFHKWT